METLISQLLSARDVAHFWHLKTKSFAVHLALQDLYDSLLECTDTLAELFQGKYGVIDIPSVDMGWFQTIDEKVFIKKLADWAEASKAEVSQDSFLVSEWDNVLAAIYKAKYKIENLA